MDKKEPNKSELILYQAEDGKIRLEVRLQDETAWLTQKMMSDLFQVTVATINAVAAVVVTLGEAALFVVGATTASRDDADADALAKSVARAKVTRNLAGRGNDDVAESVPVAEPTGAPATL